MIAEYKCLSCNLEWKQELGPSKGWDKNGHYIQPHPPPDGCPACGGLYMKWVNYYEWER